MTLAFFIYFLLFYFRYAMTVLERGTNQIITTLFCISLLMSGCKKNQDKPNNTSSSTSSPIQQEPSNSTSSNLKLEQDRDWVQDANYSLPTDVDSYYGYASHTQLVQASDFIVPYLNHDSDYAKQVNTQIYELYKHLINNFNQYAQASISFNTVDYQWTIQDHDLSLLITITTNGIDVPVNQYYTYNINTQDGNQFSFNKALELTGIESSDQLIQDAITSILHDFYNGDDFSIYQEKSFEKYTESLKTNSISYFLDQNNQLNVIVTLELPIGRGQFDTIITL